MCPKDMCIVLYFKCILLYVNLCSVVVFHRSIVNWRGYNCPKYVCILIYVQCMWCSGIP